MNIVDMEKKELTKLRNELLEEKNLDLPVKKIIEQIEIFRNGIPYLKLVKPCTIADGIKVISENEHNSYISLFKLALYAGRVIKFVPASGAATRMFKSQLSILVSNNQLGIKTLTERALNGDADSKLALQFFENIHRFAFYEELKNVISRDGKKVDELISQGNVSEIINYVTTEIGLNYSNLPKGCILFHKYPQGARTAFEEHLVEAINYSASNDGKVRVHFTISPEHEKLVSELFKSLTMKYSQFGWKFEIGFSYQSPSTNTVSVDLDNKPCRDDKGKIIFRPGGHGALLKNLDVLNADIIMIKNIDNIVPDHLKEETYKYKKILGGCLIYLQQKIFGYIKNILDENSDDSILRKVIDFINNEIGYELAPKFDSMSIAEKKKYLFNFLNRPVRVCGIVKNEGHPGGGPFWVKDEDGIISKQVVETPQIELADSQQRKIFDSSTHFSPVDFVCGVKDYKGENFSLEKYSNPNSGLITIKSKDGKELKALELPGLWNGGMYYWLTVFIEVPAITFSPVKEINDLLKPVHQPQNF
jgi:hypothetical protein